MGNYIIGQSYSAVDETDIEINELVTDPDAPGEEFEKSLGHLHVDTPAETQTAAVEGLIRRLLNRNSTYFKSIVDPSIKPLGKDIFKLKKIDAQIEITGSSGVAVAWGLYYYLKNYCNCHISWEGSQLNLPDELPDVDEVVISNDRFRYYQNVCTVGYSSPWWLWKQWEKHIDWMALNGINLALAFHGQEAIWERVYLRLGMTKQEISQHFAGPAFLPWSRMGNFRGWGGPLNSAWHRQTIRLQHLILERMRELGITPVLPAFAGHVPREFLRIFPRANVTKVKSWNDFEDKYCCPYFLDPTDPMFQTVGKEFLEEYIGEFGTNHIYNCDPFNENLPSIRNNLYLHVTGKSIYSAMKKVDPDAIWLLQGWFFVHDGFFWTKPRVQAFLSSVPIGRMIVLDLQSEQHAAYEKLESYFGQPFIWCMLHNFGGTLGMFGSAGTINKRVFEARQMENSSMIGTGLTPEGINQNYVIYEFMNEMGYRKTPVNLDDWFANYAQRRYGYADESIQMAWQELGRGVYNYSDVLNIRGHYVITRRPSLNIKLWYWYDLKGFFIVWSNFVVANVETNRNNLFKHDLVDITRQALQITADAVYKDIIKSYKNKNSTALLYYSKIFIELFDDLEEILASSPDFLLGRWLQEAKAATGSNEASDRANFEFNARNQITLWGPSGEIVDYANKQWSGVVADYYRPRWALFLSEMLNSIQNQRTFSPAEAKRLIFNQVELPFSYSKKVYPTEPTGDSIKIAVKIYDKWRKVWR